MNLPIVPVMWRFQPLAPRLCPSNRQGSSCQLYPWTLHVSIILACWTQMVALLLSWRLLISLLRKATFRQAVRSLGAPWHTQGPCFTRHRHHRHQQKLAIDLHVPHFQQVIVLIQSQSEL